ncbi:hypothetical protein KC887_05900 [Candidatus Kaiserbacteria bacterium]|nr:hypothetical protein [Candidatus Kaiserbacteria bacterium]
MRINKKRIGGLFVVLAMVGLSLALVTIPSDIWINVIGTQNGYLFMYLIAFIGSISTFASIPYPLFLVSLAAGGFNPILIGLTSALGVTTSDSLTFFAARRGRALLSQHLKASFAKLEKQLERHPHWLAPGLIFYGTLAPLSNDFAVISLSLMKYKYLSVIPALAVGNIIYNVAIAYFGVSVYDWVMGLL